MMEKVAKTSESWKGRETRSVLGSAQRDGGAKKDERGSSSRTESEPRKHKSISILSEFRSRESPSLTCLTRFEVHLESSSAKEFERREMSTRSFHLGRRDDVIRFAFS